MTTLQRLTLLAALLVSATSHAQVLQYKFTGTITHPSPETTVRPGDAFAGNWRVDLGQVGQDISTPEAHGRQYELGALRIDMNGESVLVEGGTVFVTENPVAPTSALLYPSGFSSDYVASVGTADLQRWNTEVWRYRIVFSYDGLGVWNSFAQPESIELLRNLVGSALLIGARDNGEIIGRIDSVTTALVPLPSPIGMIGAALSAIFFMKKVGHSPGRLST